MRRAYLLAFLLVLAALAATPCPAEFKPKTLPKPLPVKVTLASSFEARTQVTGQEARLFAETVANERVHMGPLTVLIRTHVEIKADDRAVGRLDSGQTVQLVAKRSFERSRAFRSHAPPVRKLYACD